MNEIRSVMESIFYGDSSVNESEGLTNRKQTDTFKNEQTGEVIKFVKIFEKITIGDYIDAIKQDNASFNSTDALSKENLKLFIDAWYGNLIDIENINIISSKTKARPNDILMVVIFEDTNGVKRAYVKVGKGSGVSWKNTDFGNETGFFLQKKASVTEKLPIKMSDVFPKAVDDESPNVVMTVEKFVEGIQKYMSVAKIPTEVATGISDLLASLMSNTSDGPIVIPSCGQHLSVFEKYVGEMVAPICLYKNRNIIAPDTPIAEIYKDFGSNDIPFNASESKIKVYRGVSTRIIDSKLKDTAGNSLGISSKAKSGGADASIDVLYDTIKKMEADGLESELVKMKEDMVIDVITVIRNNNSFSGPVVAAKLLGIFDENNANDLYEILNTLTMSRNVKANIQKIESVIDIEKYPFIAKYNFNPKKQSGGYMKTFHIITVLARMVCDKMNNEKNVSDHIKKLLSRKSLVQAYSNFSKSKDGNLVFNNIKVVYPAKLPRNILMSSEKPYSASYINGKITFSISRS